MKKEIFRDFDDVVSIADLCLMLRIGRNTAYRVLRDGLIKCIKVGRKYIVAKSDVIDFLEVR